MGDLIIRNSLVYSASGAYATSLIGLSADLKHPRHKNQDLPATNLLKRLNQEDDTVSIIMRSVTPVSDLERQFMY
ncbi:MAG: hypothetical protein ACKVLL_12935 [Verrucomicrobiales bacterium]|jgi:hypothetical protein